jgi:DNA-binding LytR/AlgR family response regulator
MKYRLVCGKENTEILRALCRASHIALDPESPYVLCEDGVPYDGACDILIRFRKEKIDDLMALLQGEAQPPALLMGIRDDHYVPMELHDIAFIYAYGNDTYARTIGGTTCRIKHKLYELEDDILPRHFIRINKSEIVNIKHIQKIIPMFKGRLLLDMQGVRELLAISRNYVKSFKERIGM